MESIRRHICKQKKINAITESNVYSPRRLGGDVLQALCICKDEQ